MDGPILRYIWTAQIAVRVTGFTKRRRKRRRRKKKDEEKKEEEEKTRKELWEWDCSEYVGGFNISCNGYDQNIYINCLKLIRETLNT